MKTDMTIDVTNGCFEAKVDPKTTYTPAYLKLTSGGSEIGIQATDEQLEEIVYAIQQHLNPAVVYMSIPISNAFWFMSYILQ